MRRVNRQARSRFRGQRLGSVPSGDELSGEEGSTLILIIFSAALAMALILGVSAATSLYLERKRLLTLADGAALAASESFDLSTVSLDSAGGIMRPTLTNAAVAQAAQQYIARVNSGASSSASSSAGSSGQDEDNGPRSESPALSRAVTEDGRSATVGLTTYWYAPVLSLFLPEGIRIDVESTARSVFF